MKAIYDGVEMPGVDSMEAVEALGEILCCLDTIADPGNWKNLTTVCDAETTCECMWCVETKTTLSPLGDDHGGDIGLWVSDVLSGKDRGCPIGSHPHEGLAWEPTRGGRSDD